MKLSASIIAKNEEAHIETCLRSLKGIDEIIVIDTGSEDKTCEIARKYTDKVYENEYKWNDNFAEARNYALSKTTGEWIISIDCDEFLEPGGIAKIRKAIAESEGFNTIKCNLASVNGVAVHRYPRIFKRGVFWVGEGHETLNVVEENPKDITITYGYSEAHKKDPDRMFRILSKAVEKNPNKPRELYYLAREYWYRKNYETAIKYWEDYLKISTWLPERADAYLMIARCYWLTQRGDKARESCANALLINANFKEAVLLMAEMSWPNGNKEQWLKLAETADNRNVLFIRTNQIQPVFTSTPKVSIVIPSLGRPEKLQRLLDNIKVNTDYPNYEVIVEYDSFEDRQGCPKTLKKGVEKSTGELVMFLGNDCIPAKGFLEYAMIAMSQLPDGWGMVGLNDGIHDGNKLVTHWLISKKMLPLLDGEFFCTEFEHCFCDNELIDRAKEMKRYIFAPLARIYHDNPIVVGGEQDEVLKIAYDKARFEKDRQTYLKRKIELKNIKKKMKKRYILYSTPFYHRSGGLMALYNLQKILIRKGFDCIYYFTPEVEVAKQEITDNDVIIYPEVICGNPLEAKNVVRWLLNIPGVCGGDGLYSNTDLIFCYLPKDYPNMKGYLFIPNWEEGLKDLGLIRKYDCIWVYKGVWKKRIPIDGVEITSNWPKSKQELINLLQHCKTLYTYDDCTCLAHEAKLCGCDVKLINADGSIIPYPYPEGTFEYWAQSSQHIEEFIRITQAL